MQEHANLKSKYDALVNELATDLKDQLREHLMDFTMKENLAAGAEYSQSQE